MHGRPQRRRIFFFSKIARPPDLTVFRLKRETVRYLDNSHSVSLSAIILHFDNTKSVVTSNRWALSDWTSNVYRDNAEEDELARTTNSLLTSLIFCNSCRRRQANSLRKSLFPLLRAWKNVKLFFLFVINSSSIDVARLNTT